MLQDGQALGRLGAEGGRTADLSGAAELAGRGRGRGSRRAMSALSAPATRSRSSSTPSTSSSTAWPRAPCAGSAKAPLRSTTTTTPTEPYYKARIALTEVQAAQCAAGLSPDARHDPDRRHPYRHPLAVHVPDAAAPSAASTKRCGSPDGRDGRGRGATHSASARRRCAGRRRICAARRPRRARSPLPDPLRPFLPGRKSRRGIARMPRSTPSHAA